MKWAPTQQSACTRRKALLDRCLATCPGRRNVHVHITDAGGFSVSLSGTELAPFANSELSRVQIDACQ